MKQFLQWVQTQTEFWQQHKQQIVVEVLFTSSSGETLYFLNSSLDCPVSTLICTFISFGKYVLIELRVSLGFLKKK